MTPLKNLSDLELIESLARAKRDEDQLLVSVLEHVHEFERRKLYLELGFPSLFAYLTKKLNYSEAEAYRRIESARMMSIAPQLKTYVNDGRLSLTAIAEVRTAVRGQEKASQQKMPVEKQVELAEAVINCTKKETQAVLAARLPFYKPVTFEQKRELIDGGLQVTFRMTRNQRQKSDRARDFMAHKGPVLNMASLHENLCEFYLQKRDPSSRPTQRFCSGTETSRNTSYIPVDLRRAVFERDQGQCQFLARDGKICGSTYQIELDHIIPRSRGGTNTIENLRCVCRAHNQWKGDKPQERTILSKEKEIEELN